jgi:hypothetical protein
LVVSDATAGVEMVGLAPVVAVGAFSAPSEPCIAVGDTIAEGADVARGDDAEAGADVTTGDMVEEGADFTTGGTVEEGTNVAAGDAPLDLSIRSRLRMAPWPGSACRLWSTDAAKTAESLSASLSKVCCAGAGLSCIPRTNDGTHRVTTMAERTFRSKLISPEGDLGRAVLGCRGTLP